MVWDENKLLGHILYEEMKKESNGIMQIDAGTGESETYESALDRSVRLALSMRKLGLKPGDVMAYSGKNHLDLHIPFYAALMNGLPIAGVDPNFKYEEYKSILDVTKPKIGFCDPEQYEDFVRATRDLGLDTMVFKFGKGENSMAEVINSWQDDAAVEFFEPSVFDQDKVYAWLISTGGTTGVIKVAAFHHKTIIKKINFVARMFNRDGNEKKVKKFEVITSPVQWVSAFYHAFTTPVLHDTKLQTSAPLTPEHAIDIINTYRPSDSMLPPSIIAGILKCDKPCDFSNVKTVVLSGSKVHTDVIIQFKRILPPGAMVLETYGQTENLGPILAPNPHGPVGACGKPLPNNPVKLVDPETGKDITESHVVGELWTKSNSRMAEYYNNPEETAKAFEDGWYKTGDLMYRDTEHNYFFVERMKMLIKYRNYHIVPTELETLIQTHPEVDDVCVTSIPHLMDGEHAVACVVKSPGSHITEEDICQLVVDKLSDNKKLRGGVLFMEKLPYTSSGKMARNTIKNIVLEKFKDKIEA